MSVAIYIVAEINWCLERKRTTSVWRQQLLTLTHLAIMPRFLVEIGLYFEPEMNGRKCTESSCYCVYSMRNDS